MSKDWMALAVVSFTLLPGLTAPAAAEVRLPSLLSDHMVVQRGEPVRVWGTATPGERVTVRLAGAQGAASADAAGNWETTLGPFAAGGPHVLEVTGTNTLRVEDVLVGEVWLASGQSNMEFPLDRAANAAREIPIADFPQIREFAVAKEIAREPRVDVTGRWQACAPKTAGAFSAVGYFFARELHAALGVPVAIIHSSWGGTPAEAWTSRGGLLAQPDLRPLVERFDATLADPNATAAYERAMREWELRNVAVDTGNEGLAKGWARPDLDAAGWAPLDAPPGWESAGLDIDGAVWLRREVEIAPAWAGKELELTLGAIDDFDTTYFDGTEVGRTGMETPGYWTYPRRYVVPAALVHAGKAVIAVRVFDRAGDGGLVGPGAVMRLAPVAGGAPVSVAGSWRYRVERSVGPLHPDWGSQPVAPQSQNGPALLFNAMVAPLTRFSLRGVIWYQGEANASRAYEYRHLFPVMIRDWRRAWGRDLPFLFVQLANFMKRASEPGESEWAELREAQLRTLAEPHTGMAVAIDVGEADDIHPRDKQSVGHRLALWALSGTYGQPGETTGPLYASHTIDGARVRVRFEHAAGLRTSDGGAPQGFAVAGADRKFVVADAAVDGGDVVVSSARVPSPVAVRYGWADNPLVTLVNGAGLPASPFRTDEWPGLTAR